MRTIRPLTAATTVLAASTASFVLAVPTAWSAVPSTCDGKPVTLTNTTDGDDFFVQGTPGDDVIHLGAGDDYFLGNGGNDTVCGGDGADLVRLDVDGATGGSRVFGGPGADTLIGTVANEVLWGEGGNDRIQPNGGSDNLNGGTGNEDQVDFLGSEGGAVGVNINAQKGVYTVPTGNGTVKAVERFTGTNANDVFRGTPGPDDFKGLLGDDDIRTYKGPDYVQAAGDSVVRTGWGRDLLSLAGNVTAYAGRERDTVLLTGNGEIRAYGQRGPDIFSITDAGYVNGGPGRDAVTLQAQQGDEGVNLDLHTGKGFWIDNPDKGPFYVFRSERITGTKHRDILKGRYHRLDVFYGGSGNDTFYGRGRADRFYGEKGKRDVGYGGKGDDLCDVEIAHSCRRPDLTKA
ncbi:MAG TPA: calcium-binding protein [Nocardioidaceae bacterium]|nr:calcium-binding protein [Nocardioidaceae bacterium]